ncbi:DUF58 domain-containing protein [Paenibacillus senegalensis]|uniref:DUF58 domain-containing protein n=1 Tax=Paenibacillus senegalensis TaxID=1465766 RepID=UPI0002885B53|nr:DUF58 domain-containing protein [Paenibacillus senegalensis]
MSIAWTLFVAFLIIAGQSLIYKKWALKNITVTRHFSRSAVFEGEEVQLVEKISNRKLLPVPWLKLESLIHANLQFRKQFNLNISGGEMFQNHSSLFSLMPNRLITRRHYIVCKGRGAYNLNSATVTCGDLVGLQSVYTTIPLNAELLVYPRTLSMDEIPLTRRSWQGELLVKRWVMPDPFMIQGVREYRNGDSMKDVNWKATASTGELQVHNRGFTADQKMIILLNFEVSEKMWNAVTDPELVELGIRYAATIAEDGIRQGMEVGFGTNGYTVDAPKEPVWIPPLSGQEHMTHLYETMAKLVIDCSCEMAAYLEREFTRDSGNVAYVFITAHTADKLMSNIRRLERNGSKVDIIPLEHKQQAEAGSTGDVRSEVEGEEALGEKVREGEGTAIA